VADIPPKALVATSFTTIGSPELKTLVSSFPRLAESRIKVGGVVK
jgi:hypothetical protein